MNRSPRPDRARIFADLGNLDVGSAFDVEQLAQIACCELLATSVAARVPSTMWRAWALPHALVC